ncbi:MAG: Holliday junction branch migration protein RuvA [Deferribacterales bacterium]|nr:Holliday junction branch migration protein RuvA [Deferribacterales bacterium]
MIYRLSGILIEKQPSFAAVDVSGVAYEAAVSLATYSNLPPIGSQVELYIHMSVREDGVFLFGFSSREEKQMFLLLVTVSGIGPKLAMKILSGVGASQLKNSIASSDYDALSAIPGVGKKTAQRIVVELKDKFDGLSEFSKSTVGSVKEDVISALVNLGYKQPDCRKAVESAPEDGNFEEVLKAAFKNLSGKG